METFTDNPQTVVRCPPTRALIKRNISLSLRCRQLPPVPKSMLSNRTDETAVKSALYQARPILNTRLRHSQHHICRSTLATLHRMPSRRPLRVRINHRSRRIRSSPANSHRITIPTRHMRRCTVNRNSTCRTRARRKTMATTVMVECPCLRRTSAGTLDF